MNIVMIYIKERLFQSDIGQRIARGAFWSLSGTIIAKLLVLISGIICAHILTKSEYGQFGMVRSTINLFVTLGSAGMGVTAAKYISEYRVSDKCKISNIFVLTNVFAFITGLIVTTIVLLLAPEIANNVLHSSELTPSLRIGALLLFVTIINGAQNGTLSGFEAFKSIAFNTLYGSMAESILLLVGAYFGGVFGAILGFGTGYIVLYVANQVSIKRQFKTNNITITKFKLSREILGILYKFSLPAALASCITAPTFFIVRAMLSNFNGFEEVAIYEAADQWRIIVLFIPASISQIVLPILSGLSVNRTNEFWKVLKINITLNVVVASAVALIVAILSPWIMNLYGGAYGSNALTLIILVASTIFSAVSNVVGAAIQSRAKTWLGFYFNLFWAFLIIAITFFFLNKGMGASAVSLAFLLSYITLSLMQIVYLKNTIKSE